MELYGPNQGRDGPEPDRPAEWHHTGLEESMWRLGLGTGVAGREVYPERSGVSDCLEAGSSLGLVGYGIQYLFLTHRIACLSVMAGNSICWINTVCYIVSVRNVPLQRQAAVGLSTGYIGLSPVIYTAIVNTLSSTPVQRAEDYLLLKSILPLIVGLVAAPFVGSVDSGKGKRLEAGFIVFSLTTVATGVYAIISSSMSSKLSPLINAVGLGLCMMTSLIVPLVEFVRGLLERGCYIRRDGRVCDDNAIVGNDEVGAEAESGVKEVLEIHHDDEVHVRRC
ncbi:hypothetical protein Droror1_Dr00003600 [Drosera rotundifolia]